MPIVRISAEDANRNLRGNRASIWPDGRVNTSRLGDIAKVSLKPTFSFSAEDKVLTIGSCFAREIERQLTSLGLIVPMTEAVMPAEERFTKTENDALNKYTVQSIENELIWASGQSAPPPPEKLFLELEDGVWHDPQLVHNIKPASIERLKERRHIVQTAFEKMSECAVVVITLGLAEAWFDHETGLYLNTAPPPKAVARYPGRFSLDILSYDDILGSLERILVILKQHGHPDFRMLVTVSPVPFRATFSGEDALIANTYSKSVQRAAVFEFSNQHPEVDYFPSYEIVTLSKHDVAFEIDNTHVSAVIVSKIMRQVVSSYAPTITLPEESIEPRSRGNIGSGKSYLDILKKAKHAAGERDFELSATYFETLLSDYSAQLSEDIKFDILSRYGTVLSKLGRYADVRDRLSIAAAQKPNDAQVRFRLGHALFRLDVLDDAIAHLEAAAALDSDPKNALHTLGQARERKAALAAR